MTRLPVVLRLIDLPGTRGTDCRTGAGRQRNGPPAPYGCELW
jgi:hypothetical protein